MFENLIKCCQNKTIKTNKGFLITVGHGLSLFKYDDANYDIYFQTTLNF